MIFDQILIGFAKAQHVKNLQKPKVFVGFLKILHMLNPSKITAKQTQNSIDFGIKKTKKI